MIRALIQGRPMRNHRCVPWLIAVACVVSPSCFSRLNREGPQVTCAELQGGKINACKDGIIASCSDGARVTYEVCDDKDACEDAGQKQGRFVCPPGSSCPSGLKCASYYSDGSGACLDGNREPANAPSCTTSSDCPSFFTCAGAYGHCLQNCNPK